MGIGLFVSGAILLSVCSYLYVEEIITLQALMPIAFVGAAIGDHSGYYLGRFLGPRFHQTSLAKRQHERISKIEQRIVEYGSLTIIFGRIMTPIRSVVPLLIGVSGMPNRKYTLYDLLACLIWSSALGLSVAGIERLWHLF